MIASDQNKASSSKPSSSTQKANNNHQNNEDDCDDEEKLDFFEMGLDDRILKAIALLGWYEPTPVQEKAIPIALDGHDILARARTGSGKTAVFAIPIIDKILKYKQINPYEPRKTRAIIVAPSKELCHQIRNNILQLTSCSLREVRCIDVAAAEPNEIKPLLIAEPPDIIVGTPSRILAHIKLGSLVNLKKSVTSLVIDEADLLFSFGFEKDTDNLIEHVKAKTGCQSFLVSATLNTDVASLKKLVLYKPVIIKLEEPELPECEQLAQYHVGCQKDEKFVLLIALIKLNLLRGRTIIFVNSLTMCYKLKLFLEQFAVKSCLLNPELPVATRLNVVEQFNKGVYNLIIASDERCVHDPTERKKTKSAAPRKKLNKDFAVSRGIDFQSVSNVINFEFPATVTAYVHRVGRTARALNSVNSNITEGTVLSFVASDETKSFNKVKTAFGENSTLKPYAFKMEELDAFKYRAKDAIRAVTKGVIRTVRLKEIQTELKNSERLRSILNSNTNDVELLKHDRSVRRINTPYHLRDVPDYIVPATLKDRQRHISLTEKRKIDKQAELTAPNSRKSKKKSSKGQHRRSLDPLRKMSKKKKVKKGKKTSN